MAEITLLGDRHKADNWRQAFLWLQGVFYFFQGFYWAGSYLYIMVSMGMWSVPIATQATVGAILGIPTYIKMFPALISDRVPIGRWGRRKPYIIMGLLLYLPGYALLISTREFSALWVGAIVVALVAWMLVDGVLDALTVDITPQEKIGRMQSVASASRLAGVALSSLVVPFLGAQWGWTAVLVLLGGCALIQSSVTLLYKETPISRELLARYTPLGKVVKASFGQPLMWVSMAFALFFTANRGFGNLINAYLLTELGWSGQADMVQYFGLLRLLGALSGVIGAVLMGRIAPKRFLSVKFTAVYLVFFWLAITPWFLVMRAPDNLLLITLAKIIFGFTGGINSVLTLTVAMRACPPSLEGFMFATIVAMGDVGNLTLGPKTVTAFSPVLGGLVPAFFTLIPYGALSVVFMRMVLRGLEKQEGEAIHAVDG